MARVRAGRLALIIFGVTLLSGCEEGANVELFKRKPATAADTDAPVQRSSSVKLVERDVEAPDAFQVAEQGLWDGRPSLGGVWVAYPDVKDPERVIIRNEKNGKFVIGALFRRERDNPGPKLQVSSDAAAALGMLAGAPGPLNVTALRREEVPEAAPTPAPEAALEAPEVIAATPLEPIAAASAAIDRAEAAQATPPPPAPSPKKSKLDKPFIQIGLFSVEENANRTGTVLRGAGVVPTVSKEEARGKAYWRVIVGPAFDAADRTSLLKKVKDLGYSDAYFVAN